MAVIEGARWPGGRSSRLRLLSAGSVPVALAIAALVAAGLTILWGQYAALALIAVGVAPVLVVVDGAPVWFFLVLFPSVGVIDTPALTLSRGLVILCFAAWLLGAAIGTQTWRFRPTVLDGAIVALAVLQTISVLTLSFDPVTLVQSYIRNLVIYILIRFTSTTRRGLFLAVSAFLVGNFLSAAAALIHGQHVVTGGVSRLTYGTSAHNANFFAGQLLGAVGLAVGMALVWPTVRTRLVLWASAGSMLIVIALIKSRGTFVAALSMIVIGFMVVRGFWNRLVIAVLACAALVVALPGPASLIGLQDYSNRIQTILGGNGHLDARWYEWQMGIEVVREHPLTGVGPANIILPSVYWPLAAKINQPSWVVGPAYIHSFLFSTAADLGLPGLLAAIVALAAAAFMLWNALRAPGLAEDRRLAGCVYGFVLAYAGYFVAIQFTGAEQSPWPFMVLALIAGLNAVIRARRPVEKAQARDARPSAIGRLGRSLGLAG